MNQSSEQVDCSKDIQGHVTQVEGFVFATIILLGILFLLGALRRRSSSGILAFALFLIYTAVAQTIPYIMGLMKSSPFSHELFPVWASMLLFAYGSADNMIAYSLDELQSTAKFLWGFILQFIWLSMILFFKITGLNFVLPCILLIPLMFLKVAERGMALSFATKTSGLESVTMRLADYMKTEDELGQVLVPDPDNYLVDVTDVTVRDHKITDGITLGQIWECQGRLLKSTGGDPDGLLKDTCLSIALFWLLLRKFAGYPLHESKLDKTWKFVSTRLLPDQDDDPAKAFRVIEVELNFLFDYFYTKYFFYYYNRYIVKVLHIVLVLSFASLTMYNLKNYHPRHDYLGVRYLNFEVDVLVTWIMVGALVVLEIVQLCCLVTSRWFKVSLLCYYVKQKIWLKKRKQDSYIEKAIEIICTSIPSSATLVRPWQRKLNQYSLLGSYKRVCIDFASRMLYLNLKIPITTMSRKSDSVELTPAVIKAVFQTLKKNGPRLLTNGITSLVQNEVEALSWACQFEMTTDLILAWHVATTLCEFHSRGKSQSEATKTNVDVAAKLSQYCAYLVAKAPILLPDHSFKCMHIYSIVILDAKRLLKECNSMEDVYHELVVKEIGDEEENAGKVMRRGAKIGKHLIDEIGDQERMWKILADFWAELILFLAPSDKEMAHAECLAEGGEFITHLWALLIHAGILSREEVDHTANIRRSNTV